jgi:NADH-quinone oxidoreductase subunit E
MAQKRAKSGPAAKESAHPKGRRAKSAAGKRTHVGKDPAQPKPSLVELVIARHHGQKRGLIPILEELEEHDGWLSPEILDEVARQLDLFPSHVYSVATFYKAFSLEPRGRHRCTVCMGTACHVRGGAAILEHFERKLGIQAGQTSADREFTLERVNCLGACALAPLAVVDGRYYGQMTEVKADAVLKTIEPGKSKSEGET